VLPERGKERKKRRKGKRKEKGKKKENQLTWSLAVPVCGRIHPAKLLALPVRGVPFFFLLPPAITIIAFLLEVPLRAVL